MFDLFKRKPRDPKPADADGAEARSGDAADATADAPAEPARVIEPEAQRIPGDAPAPAAAAPPDAATWAEPESGGVRGFFSRLRTKLGTGTASLARDLGNLVPGKKIDAEVLDDLETRLLMADVGVDATQTILEDLRRRVARKELGDLDALLAALRRSMTAILAPVAKPLVVDRTKKPYVVLVVGVNGSGKTTSIGKLARRYTDSGHKVVLAAGDTFRAAAVEQLQVWGERNGVPVIAQATGADPAAVAFDALQAAKARGADLLLADTAGRLQNQGHLMEELKKVKRVLAKVDPTAPHEVLLVLDASQGQNALNQAQVFHQALGVTGIVLTKLDGTAKGGIVLAIAQKLGIPLRFVGIGEGIGDFGEFDADGFVRALLGEKAQ